MTRDFLWWIARSTSNRLRRQLRRLRSPRYLIATLLGAAYFWFVFGGMFRGDVDASAAARVGAARLIGPVALALLTAWWWLWGGHRRALLLSPAETNLLLPAPILRPALIRFKIMQAQVPMVFSALLFTLFTRGSPLPWPLRALSLWLMFATLHLHQIAASLVHATAAEHGARGVRRNRIAVALFGVGFAVLTLSVMRAVFAARAAGSLAAAANAAVEVLSEPAPRAVLAPFRLLMAPTVAPSITAWALPALAVTLLLLLHYVWVQRTDAAFEETAIAEGARQAEQIAIVRAGGLSRLRFSREQRPAQLARPWLSLEPTGHAAFAILWKNVLYIQRLLRPATFVIFGGGLVAMIAISVVTTRSLEHSLRGIATVLFGVAALATVVGPLAFRNDLRMDLMYVDQLRTYPLRGRDVVRASVVAAALCVTVMQLLLVLPALATAFLADMLGPLLALGAALLAFIVLPILNVMAVLLQNAIALLFPAWSRLGDVSSGGMESMGQNILNLIGTIVLLVLVAIPPAVVGAVVAAPLALQFGNSAIVPGAAAALAAIVAEVMLLTRWLGLLYDRLDPVEAELLR